MKNSGTKYPSSYVKANSASAVDSAIAMAKSQLRDASEHFVNDEGDDCFAIYEDDAIKIVTDILESLRKDS